MNIKKLPMNVIGYTSVFILILMVVFSLVVKPNEEKKEYMGVVVETYGGTSTVVFSEMEPPFKQTRKSNETTITGTIISSNGDSVLVKDESSALYRVMLSGSTHQVGEIIDVSVVRKSTETRIIRNYTSQRGDIIVTRVNLENDLNGSYRNHKGEIIYTINAPVNTITLKDNLGGKIVIVSKGFVYSIHHCKFGNTERYMLNPLPMKHSKDGIYEVGEEDKLIPKDDSVLQHLSCEEGVPYRSLDAVFERHPMLNKEDDAFFYFLFGVPTILIIGSIIVVLIQPIESSTDKVPSNIYMK